MYSYRTLHGVWIGVENVSNDECSFEWAVARDREGAEVEKFKVQSSKFKVEKEEQPKMHFAKPKFGHSAFRYSY